MALTRMWVVSYGIDSGKEAAVDLTGIHSQRVQQVSTRTRIDPLNLKAMIQSNETL